MTKKKLLTMVTALGLVGAVGVGGTLAWLTAETDPVVNTFAVGPGFTNEDGTIKINLLESLVTRNPANGAFTRVTGEAQIKTGDEVTLDKYEYSTEQQEDDSYIVSKNGTEGISYEGIVPGSVIPKNPTVFVEDDIVNSRLYVLVEGLDDIADIGTVDVNDAWDKVANTDKTQTDNGEKDGYYQYVGKNGNAETTGIISETLNVDFYTEPLFTTITVNSSLTESELETKIGDGKAFDSITINAGIIQADNIVDDEDTADKDEIISTMTEELFK